MADLTDKQLMFCFEYLKDLNATQAAIRAGYSEKTAKEIGAQNLSKLNIQEKLAELKADRADRLQIEADEVLQEVYWLATSRATDIVNIVKGKVKLNDTETLPEKAKAVIASIGETRSGITVKMHSKPDALEKLMKHLGLYEKDNEQLRQFSKVIVNVFDNGVEPITSEDDIDENI